MQSHDQLVKKLLRRPGVRAEVERIEREEGVLLDALLKARQDAGLTQAQVAERMGTTQSVVARLESGRRAPSMRTVQRYAQAVGARAVVHLVVA